MTELLTACYRRWVPSAGQPVVLSLTTPRDLPEAKTWPVLHVGTPRWSYFRAPYHEFDAAYVAQLERFGPAKIARALHAIARETEAKRLILCCWEDANPEITCHRRLFARWWLLATGEEIPELDPAQPGR